MQKIIVSLNDNILRVSTIEKGNFKGTYTEISTDIVQKNIILQPKLFSEILNDLIKNLTNLSYKNLSLNILIEPEDVYFRFIQVNKNEGDVEDQVINEITIRNKDIPLNDIYFSYNKIAPFVYQFTGIKKDTLEKYLEISNFINISLENVTAWPILFPKFLGINDPAIFISKINTNQIVSLSEFNGIFYLGIYQKEKSTEELQKIITELSIYKRKDPINKVYLFNYDNFSLNSNYDVMRVDIPGSDNDQAIGFELHLMYDKILNDDNKSLIRLINLLNLLPLPVIQDKNKSALVYVGVGITSLLLVGGAVLLGTSIYKKSKTPQVIQNSSQLQVLSESVTNEPENNPPVQIQPQVELKKQDLSIRIENGAGIQGIAGKTQEFMQNLGYKINSIGNADESGRLDTLLKFKNSSAKYKDLVKADMENSFKLVVQEDLDPSVEYDLLIIVGSDAQL